MIAAKDVENTDISYQYPPGIYAQGSVQRTLNLGDSIKTLSALPDFGGGVRKRIYDEQYERDMLPILLASALAMMLLDWIVMIALSGRYNLQRFKRSAAMVCFCLSLALAPSAMAQNSDDIKYADGFYLGFIQSANAGLNAQTRAGLEALSEALTRRTSAEPDGVAALNAETSELSFFPLLYWPVDASDKPLSEAALRNVQRYLDNGGTILFDTREDVASVDPMQGGTNAAALREMISGLNIPALAPIGEDHVLGRSFYLLDTFPGRYLDGTIWVEGNSANGRDGVSSVLIGSQDWGSAWQSYAVQNSGRNYRTTGSTRQRELAIRFGINMVMYALTGNYKADQVHMKYIIERLGQ